MSRVVAEADLVIALGVREAHEFAGHTGGRKAILAATAGYGAILRNDASDTIGHPLARPDFLLFARPQRALIAPTIAGAVP